VPIEITNNQKDETKYKLIRSDNNTPGPVQTRTLTYTKRKAIIPFCMWGVAIIITINYLLPDHIQTWKWWRGPPWHCQNNESTEEEENSRKIQIIILSKHIVISYGRATLIWVHCTVKLGYNDHGYNKFTLITNKIMSRFWSQMTGYKDIFHGYNESRL